MKSDYDTQNIINGTVSGFAFKTHQRFAQYYFNEELGFENQSIHHVETLLKPGDTFVDVGSHHGYYSLIAAKKVGKQGKVFAFEPVPENKSLLDTNLNQLSDKIYKTFPYAISDKVGEATFNIPWASDSAGLHKHPLAETLKTIKVELHTLDDLFADQKIDFVKIDTEGNELAVLHGMRKTITNNPNIKMLLEFNPQCLKSAGTKPGILLQAISDYGFDIYIVDEQNSASLKLVNIRNWQPYLETVDYRNLLCVPKNTPSMMVFTHTDALGGAELAAIETAWHLQDRGCLVTVSVPGDGAIRRLCRSMQLATTSHHSDWWINQTELKISDTQSELERTISQYDYDIVACHTIANPVVPIAAKRLGKKVVWHIHENIVKFQYPYPLEKVGAYINAMSDAIVTSSDYLKTELKKSLPIFAKAEVLYPLPRRYATDRTKPTNKQHGRLVLIGRLEENKNQIDAVQALARVGDKLKPQLLLVGDGDKRYTEKLKKTIKDLRLEKQVAFVGHTPEPETILESGDILLSCSLQESFGRTIINAMRDNILVITTNGGSDYIVYGKNALTYEAGDHKTLAKLIEKAITNPPKNITDQAHRTYEAVAKKHNEQLEKMQTIVENLSANSSNDVIADDLNKQYVAETNIFRDKFEQQLTTNRELKREYDALSKSLQEVLAAQRELLNSRAWHYTSKARKVIHPIRSRKNKKQG